MLTVHANGPGLGDALVLTCLLRNVIPPDEPVRIHSAYPQIFAAWPRVEALPWQGRQSFPVLNDMAQVREHQVQAMATCLGYPPPERDAIYPELQVSAPCADEAYVVIAPRAGAWAWGTKQWPWQSWKELVRCLDVRGIPVVQIGATADPTVPGVRAAYLGEPIEQSAIRCKSARVAVTLVSGPMHLATAVGTPVVALFGGREDPAKTGYARNVNLTGNAPQGCTPCWQLTCPWRVGDQLPCMQPLTPLRVAETIATLWRTH